MAPLGAFCGGFCQRIGRCVPDSLGARGARPARSWAALVSARSTETMPHIARDALRRVYHAFLRALVYLPVMHISPRKSHCTRPRAGKTKAPVLTEARCYLRPARLANTAIGSRRRHKTTHITISCLRRSPNRWDWCPICRRLLIRCPRSQFLCA